MHPELSQNPRRIPSTSVHVVTSNTSPKGAFRSVHTRALGEADFTLLKPYIPLEFAMQCAARMIVLLWHIAGKFLCAVRRGCCDGWGSSSLLLAGRPPRLNATLMSQSLSTRRATHVKADVARATNIRSQYRQAPMNEVWRARPDCFGHQETASDRPLDLAINTIK
ncbi:hypothetical protein FA15DRAFT_661999 [Coprinopsis marcescibilis]|uniref:Uncharacterized protein n=1 Tax=Coprinopsis marcescibilis TaxID=230819 RepID=A0A5C3K9N2_COPMA|nr:hypothetical protein FA15DRAFT_661999 [Coprinopsis marcescibilis]